MLFASGLSDLLTASEFLGAGITLASLSWHPVGLYLSCLHCSGPRGSHVAQSITIFVHLLWWDLVEVLLLVKAQLGSVQLMMLSYFTM